MSMQFIVDQLTGNAPKIHPQPTTRHGLSMINAAQPKPRPRQKQGPKKKAGRKHKQMLISVNELRRLYESGASIPDLEKAAGVARNTVIQRLGDSFTPQPNRLPDDVLKRAAALRKQGVPWQEVQERCGHHHKTLYRAAKLRGFI